MMGVLAKLPQIPVIDARDGGPLLAARMAEAQMRELLRCADRLIPRPLLAVSDRLSRRWFARGNNPYLEEIDAVAALIGRNGAYTLNASFEWCCTCGVADDEEGGVRLLRVLDWRQAGLGRLLIVVRQQGPAGDFFNLTWPGFVGVVTAMAPKRFAVALNQPPMRSWGLTPPLDWLIGRVGVWQSQAVPPAHLLRQICETCFSYEEARSRLTKTPLCLPGLFTLAGVESGKGCVIERTPNQAAIRELPAAVANHWSNLTERGRPRGHHSRDREAQMQVALTQDYPWQTPPIINRDTRLVAVINPSRGRLLLQGWEKDGPATAPLMLENT